MPALYSMGGVLVGCCLLVLLVSFICFMRVFYLKRPKESDEIRIPDGAVYEPFRDKMVAWVRATRAMQERYPVSITSKDGLTLTGMYYPYADGAPLEILFHGYRGSAERDLSGGVARCFALGHSALIVDQRGCGGSGGHLATFGAKERQDCLLWVDFAERELAGGVPIILTGISMGAATVMLCADAPLPRAVVGILADCGYTSAEQIIKKVIRDMKLPAALLYPFVALGARLYGGFSLRDASPIDTVRRSRLPIIFFHGASDDFVPCFMSEQLHEICPTRKALVITEGAGHGLCFPIDEEGYIASLRTFFDPICDEYERNCK